MTRRLLAPLAPLSGAALLALWPAPAAAGTAIVTQPVSVHGYTMRIVADNGYRPTSVSVVLFQRVGGFKRVGVPSFGRVGGSIQWHEWDADGAVG